MNHQMKVTLLIFLFSIPILGYAQNENTANFKSLVTTVYGDLNKDGLIDLAVVTQDTISDNAPYLLEVFFKQANGDLKLIVSSTKAIEPQFPSGRENHFWGVAFDKLRIQKGVLWIEIGFTRGHMEHKFRYQNDRFELIGYTYIDVNAGQIEQIDYNLSTGRRIEKEGTISEDDYTVVKDEVIKLTPLPKLEDFEPFVHELY